MLPSPFHPSDAQIRTFEQQERERPFSYPFVGKTLENQTIPGFDNDLNRQVLGQGEAAWEAAKQAIRQWRMFPGRWAKIWPENAPIQPGQTVVMLARVTGLWWINSCRIVYTLDEPTRFGFAYGTLPGHVECGEELFLVEQLPDGTVQYVLKAFSRPRYWMARLAYPLARAYQRKFIRESKAGMLQFVQQQLARPYDA